MTVRPQPGWRFAVLLAFVLFGLGSGALWADNAAAERALMDGRMEEATRTLQTTLAQNPGDASAHLLLCRVFYAQEMTDQAIEQCEAATAGNGSDSYLWLGRVQGAKAAKSNPISAFALARKVRGSFETAVRLNGANLPALSDLGEFYVNAPAIVGGGLDRARALAPRMLAQSPRRGHQLLARIAEKAGDAAAAEAELRFAGRSPEALVDLGFFLVRHRRVDEAVAVLTAAADADRAHDAALVDAASTLTLAGRSPQLAIRCLRDYLSSPAKSDAAPAFKVHLQLGDLLARSGDRTAAGREYAAAASLAPAFASARGRATSNASAARNVPSSEARMDGQPSLRVEQSTGAPSPA